jgi:hypothetical protein
MGPQQPGPLAVPGKYTVKMTVDGKTMQQPLTILIDPHTSGSQQGMEATLKMQLRIRDNVNKTADMINLLDAMHRKLQDLEGTYGADPAKAAALTAVRTTDQKTQDVEYQLVSKNLLASDDKTYISQYKVYFNLLWLNGEVGQGAGDVAGGGDYGPTETSPKVLAEIEADLAKGEVAYKELVGKTIPALNQTLSAADAIPLTVPPAAPAPPRRPRGGE